MNENLDLLEKITDQINRILSVLEDHEKASNNLLKVCKNQEKRLEDCESEIKKINTEQDFQSRAIQKLSKPGR